MTLASAYPPIPSVNADIPASTLRARSRHSVCLPVHCEVAADPPDRDTPFWVGCDMVLEPMVANAVQSAGVYHAFWRRGVSVAARGASAAVFGAGHWVAGEFLSRLV